MNPLDDFGHHLSILRKKADVYASRLQSSKLSATDSIRIFRRSIYTPAMRYSIPVIAVDEEELSKSRHGS